MQLLNNAGYNNYWQILNSKDYEIPQNRERVFIVSICKDIDTGIFEFPKPVDLKICLKDMLENLVNKKYYVNPQKVNALVSSLSEKQISNIMRWAWFTKELTIKFDCNKQLRNKRGD